jgi:hypothetical protein
MRRIVVMAFGEMISADSDPASQVLARLRERPVADSWWLTLIDDDQLRIEHALDLQTNDLAVFIDRRQSGKAPFEFSEILAAEDYRILPVADTLLPSDLLHTLSTMARQGEPPGSFLLTLPDSSDSLEQDGAAATNDNIDATVGFIEDILNNPDTDYWRSKTGT